MSAFKLLSLLGFGPRSRVVGVCLVSEILRRLNY